MGSFGGSLQAIKATELGAHAIKSALQKLNTVASGRSFEQEVEDVYMGNVLSANVGQVT